MRQYFMVNIINILGMSVTGVFSELTMERAKQANTVTECTVSTAQPQIWSVHH